MDRSVMSNAGTALMGIGRGEGKTKAEDAAAAAISSPLLDEPIDKAKGIVFNVVGGNDMSLTEVTMALGFESGLCVSHGSTLGCEQGAHGSF